MSTSASVAVAIQSPTLSGTFAVSVIATAGTVTQTTTATLTVQKSQQNPHPASQRRGILDLLPPPNTRFCLAAKVEGPAG